MERLLQKTDEELVRCYAAGEDTAFDILLSRHKNRLYSYIYSCVRQREIADDIFQDTFMKAIMKIRQGKYTDNGKFHSWINCIAHNLVVDYFRMSNTRSLMTNDEMTTFLLTDSKYLDKSIEDCLIDEQITGDIRKLILKLPIAQREVVIMRYYKNLSFKEIAEITGVSINTSLGRMRYALINMRQMAEDSKVILFND